jgi:hypothetical protein
VTSARNYSSIAASAALTSGCSNVDTTIQVDTTSGFPSVPFLLCLDKDRVAEELVLCTAIVGLALTVTRGYDGTSATAHTAGATVKHVGAGVDFQEAGNHVGDSTLHWNSTNTDTLELPWQWSRPGFITTGMTTGTPTSVSAGPTTILAGPASGRRIVKHILVYGPPAAVFTLSVASTTLTTQQLDSTSTSAAVLAPLPVCIPIANGENLQATVSSGPCVFTPVYGDRSDTLLDRRGLLSSSSSSSTNIVASGTARKFSQIWISNPNNATATAELLTDTSSHTGVLTLPARTLITIDDPLTITNAQALKGKADGTHAITFLAVGI